MTLGLIFPKHFRAVPCKGYRPQSQFRGLSHSVAVQGESQNWKKRQRQENMKRWERLNWELRMALWVEVFQRLELGAVTGGLRLIALCQDTVGACILWATISLWQGTSTRWLRKSFLFLISMILWNENIMIDQISRPCQSQPSHNDWKQNQLLYLRI